MSHVKRTIFPRKGIYECSNLPASHFMKASHARRYRYIQPAYPDMDDEQAQKCWLADCWIVDKDGNLNPGTDNCPVPIHIDNIGRRIDDGGSEQEFVEVAMRTGRGPMTDKEVEVASKMTVDQFDAISRISPGPWTWEMGMSTSLEPYPEDSDVEGATHLHDANGVAVLCAFASYPILCRPDDGRVLACSREMLDELLAVEAHLNEYVGSMASFGMETAKSRKRLESVRAIIKKATQP